MSKRVGFHDVRALRFIHTVLGLILVTGGTFKLYAVAMAYQEEDVGVLIDALLSEAKIFAGLWLATGRDPVRSRPWAIAMFTGLWVSSLYRGFAGSCSCGHFGTVPINPWIVTTFDLIALVFLLKWQPLRGNRAEAHATPLSMIAMVLVALVVATAGVGRPPLVSASGTAVRRGSPMADVMLTFRRYSVQFEVRTDGRGAFRLPPVRPGRYTVSAPPDPATPGPKSGASGRSARKGSGKPARKAASGVRRPPEALERHDGIENLSLEIDECARGGLTIDFR